jgi:heterodisulfide reductase subunit A
MGMRPRSTIYIPFPQALPNVPVIDRENCVRFKNGACGICAEVCPPQAIDYGGKDEVVRVETGAVILAPGFCLYDPVQKPEYACGLAANVLSSLQFERLLSASGPCMGNVVRPSDGKVPKRIAFVQCVGSRDEEHEWCSSVCCMYSLKEAIIAREHEHDVECTLFYMDIRAHGKGFDAYYERAKEMGIRFVRCRPSRIDELESKSLRVGYVPEDDGADTGTAGAYRTEDFDLVVLASGLEPPAEARAMAARFGIGLDANRFGASPAFNPVASSRPGVFLAGPFSEPKDIPETVVEASSAAAEAMTLLAERRGTLVTKVELPAETDIAGQVPRVGVFVCHCGKNIGAYVDVPAVREYAKTLPFVAFAMDNLYTCSSDTQVIIKSKIAEHRLNRVVVASCSPRTHEPLFQQTIREQGLNVHLFEMANIRDQCSWVHMDLKREATEKSKDLVRMAVAKSRLTEPLHAQTLPVTRAALVVGGGAAGMSAALTLADQGYDTFLVEKSPRLGGVAAGIERNLAGHGIAEHVAGLVRRVAAHPRVTVFADSHLEKVDGFVGNFETTIAPNSSNGKHGPAREPVKVKHGAVILAVGAGESRPGEYLYGKHPAVVTLLELEGRMAGGGGALPAGAAAGTVAFIQCVGSRESDHLYCSRTCCAAAIKQAIRIKEQSPDTNVLVLYRDIRTYGFREKAYGRARELGVAFIRYEPDRKPVVVPRGPAGRDGVTVTVRDPVLGAALAIPADLLVLSARVDANPDNERLSQHFKVPLNANGFFLEAHAKLRPVDFATEGVFVCGSAHYPKDTTEAIAQAKAAAARAATVLARESIEAEGKTSFVRESRCEACGACVEVCPYHAVEIDPAKNKAKVNDALCKGCGICAATCRSSAIDLNGFRDEQIMAVLKTVVTFP